MIKLWVRSSRTVILRPKHSYHVLSLLTDKYHFENVKISPPLFPLYLSRMRGLVFNERLTAVVTMDCYRTNQPAHHFQTIIDYSLANLNKFQSRESLIALINQMYFYKFSDHKTIMRVAGRVLAIKEQEESSFAFFNLKFLIAVDSLVGLQHFTQDQLRMINFKKFRPITLAMALELFYQRQLQKKMGLVEELVDMFVACESFIPVADLHHLCFAIRKIDNIKFKMCYYRVRRRIQDSFAGRNDVDNEDWSQELTEEALFKGFQRTIVDKYSTSEGQDSY